MVTALKINQIDQIYFGNAQLTVFGKDTKDTLSILHEQIEGLKALANKANFTEIVIKDPETGTDYRFAANLDDYGYSTEFNLNQLPKNTYLFSQELLDALVEAQDDTSPKGLVTPNHIQPWLNQSAAVAFDLPSVKDGCGIDTTLTWYHPDLIRKEELIKDCLENNRPEFVIEHRICTRYTNLWKKLTTRYELIKNTNYFFATCESAVVSIQAPQLVS